MNNKNNNLIFLIIQVILIIIFISILILWLWIYLVLPIISSSIIILVMLLGGYYLLNKIFNRNKNIYLNMTFFLLTLVTVFSFVFIQNKVHYNNLLNKFNSYEVNYSSEIRQYANNFIFKDTLGENSDSWTLWINKSIKGVDYVLEEKELNRENIKEFEDMCNLEIELSKEKWPFINLLYSHIWLTSCKENFRILEKNNKEIEDKELKNKTEIALKELLTLKSFKNSMLRYKYQDVKYCLEQTGNNFKILNYVWVCWMNIENFIRLKETEDKKDSILKVIKKDVKDFSSYYDWSFYNLFASLLNAVWKATFVSLGEEEFLKKHIRE